jgi:transposase-like protein
MVLARDKLKKLLKEKGVKSLDDFNAFMRDVSKDVIETLLEEELTDHLGFEKYDQKAKVIDNSRNGYTPITGHKLLVVNARNVARINFEIEIKE